MTEVSEDIVDAARNVYRPMHAREADYLSIEDNAREIVEAVAPLIAAQERERCARIAEIDDDWLQKVHNLAEAIRENVRENIDPKHRPDGFFSSVQNLIYALRGRRSIAAAIRASKEG